jgi:hypothetical protein
MGFGLLKMVMGWERCMVSIVLDREALTGTNIMERGMDMGIRIGRGNWG